MSRKALFLAAVISILLSCKVQAEVIDSNWVGGRWGFWENPNNWEPVIVPDNNASQTFTVTIDSNSIVVPSVEILIQQDHTIDDIATYGDVQLEGHNWQRHPDLIILEPTGLTNHDELDVHELDIHGDLLNGMTSFLDTYELEIKGNLINTSGAWFQCCKGPTEITDANIYNNGTILIALIGDLWAEHEFHNFGIIEMYGGSCSADREFNNKAAGIVKGFGMVHSDQVINNVGLIQSLGGSLTLHSRVDFEGPYFPNRGLTNTGTLTNSPGTALTTLVWLADVNNHGTIKVNADGSVVFDCNLVNEPNGTISLLGGTLGATLITQKADANFAGFGGITGDVVIDPNAIIQLTGPTNIFGDVTIDANSTLEISDGTTLITGHTTCDNGTIHMKGGRIIPQGGLTNNGCNIIWEPGIYSNMADFNLDGLVNFIDFADFADTWLWQSAWH
jgi:hypothetical protein